MNRILLNYLINPLFYNRNVSLSFHQHKYMKYKYLNNRIAIALIIVFFYYYTPLYSAPNTQSKEIPPSTISNTVNIASTSNNIDYKAIKTELKGGVRKLFENIKNNIPSDEFGILPEGLTIIDGNGYRGIKIVQGLMEFRTYTWLDDTGLLDNYKKCKKENRNIVAAINGSFYSERGVLGQVIQNGIIPRVRQIPARLSRCFVCAYRDRKNYQYWYIGETPLTSHQLIQEHDKNMIWFNGVAESNVLCDNLLGGGGWILKNRKDNHWEAIERQYFKFRKEDQTSRKTVVAQDSDRNLYFIVFEAGFSLYQVARTLIKDKVFKDVQEAIFLDGGSSSCIVLNGKYLVAPLYMVDKARFSCIQILTPNLIW